MPNQLNETSYITVIGLNLASIALWTLGAWMVIKMRKLLYKNIIKSKSHLYPSGILITLLALLWSILNITYTYYGFPHPEISALTTFIVFFFFLWKEMNQFSKVGLLRLDTTVHDGLDYDKALKLCTNEMAFLGIGASKLTASTEFSAAIQRCNRPNEPIRFLLTRPNNPKLEEAARQRGVDPEEYSKNVKRSLEILRELKKDRGMNIEVRFYPNENNRDFPFFRLMFIDDSLCLLSYNVFGEGDGSQLPQLHLKKFQDRRDVESFYYPFKHFFDSLWKDSSAWNFESPDQEN